MAMAGFFPAPRSQKPEEEEEPPVQARGPDEHEVTLSWVEERFRELGFNDFQAAALAEAGADWHYAHHILYRKGRRTKCSLERALELLLPDPA